MCALRRPSVGLLGFFGWLFLWIDGILACFPTFFPVQRKNTGLFEAERNMNEQICSCLFQLTQSRFTLFMGILNASTKKGFSGLPLLIIQLIKSVIKAISMPLRPSVFPLPFPFQGCTIWGWGWPELGPSLLTLFL